MRLEDSAGNVLRNRYHAPNHTIGPFQPKSSVADYEKALMSQDALLVLEALNWLGGIHLDLERARRIATALGHPDVILESEDHLNLFLAAHRTQPIQGAVAQLAQSPNPWIREAATLASDVVLDDW
jgi:hypothetical protein